MIKEREYGLLETDESIAIGEDQARAIASLYSLSVKRQRGRREPE